MTLVDYVLATIKSNWPGGIPSDIERVNADDSQLLDGSLRSRTDQLKGTNIVAAWLRSQDSTPFGAQAGAERQAIVRVHIEGLHADKHGQITDDDDFRSVVRDTKEALRAVEYDPQVGNQHPATWVRLQVGSETPGSATHKSYYQTTYDVTFTGLEDP